MYFRPVLGYNQSKQSISRKVKKIIIQLINFYTLEMSNVKKKLFKNSLHDKISWADGIVCSQSNQNKTYNL